MLGAQLLLQTAIEAEVTAFLGAGPLRAGRDLRGLRDGMRNGYCPTTVKTTAGPVTLPRPKLRGTTERFASQLFGKGVTKTNALESLVIAGFVRGLSTRDVEATLVEALGEQAAVSKSTVSRICAEIKTQFEAWRPAASTTSSWTTCSWTAATSSITPTPRPSRCWPRGASTPTANRCLSGWRPPRRSPATPGRAFSTGLGERGLACPLLVISDGAAGLIGAVERTMGAALRQRCLIHRARNVLGQGAQERPGRGEGRLLGDLRAAREIRARPGRGGQVQKPRSTRSPHAGATRIRRRCAACSTTATR